MSKEFFAGLAVLAVAVAAGCQRPADEPPAVDQTGSDSPASVKTAVRSTALTEVTLEVTGMS